METKRFTTNQQDVQAAAALLRAGETVAFPTETVYGLGANALDAQAVDKIFKAKGRPSDNPLIVHIAHTCDLDKLARTVPPLAARCMEHFWPGPLTVILPCTEIIPANVTAGLNTVGIRMPDHDIALQLIAAAGVPIAAPSANSSGRPSPTTAEHVLEDLAGKIAGVVEGGASGVGVESTVVDFSGEIPMILRPGGVTREMLEAVVGEVRIDPAVENGVGQPKAPGMKYTHYAPKSTMILVDYNWVEHKSQMYSSELSNEDERRSVSHFWERNTTPENRDEPYFVSVAPSVILKLIKNAHFLGQKVGVLTTEEMAAFYKTADVVRTCGRRSDLSTVAAGLYDAIRSFDHTDVDVIYAETFPETGVGLAVMNRLRKAAGHRVITAN